MIDKPTKEIQDLIDMMSMKRIYLNESWLHEELRVLSRRYETELKRAEIDFTKTQPEIVEAWLALTEKVISFSSRNMRVYCPHLAAAFDASRWRTKLHAVLSRQSIERDGSVYLTTQYRQGDNHSLYTSNPNIQSLKFDYLVRLFCRNAYQQDVYSVDYKAMHPSVMAGLYEMKNVQEAILQDEFYCLTGVERADVKRFILAWMYGAGDATLARAVGRAAYEVERFKIELIDRYPELEKINAKQVDGHLIRTTAADLFNKKIIELSQNEEFNPIILRHDEFIFSGLPLVANNVEIWCNGFPIEATIRNTNNLLT